VTKDAVLKHVASNSHVFAEGLEKEEKDAQATKNRHHYATVGERKLPKIASNGLHSGRQWPATYRYST
jgi:hypothetical protein